MTRRAVAPDGAVWEVRRRRRPGDDEPEDDEGAPGGEEERDPREWLLGVLLVLALGVALAVSRWVGIALLAVETILAAAAVFIWLWRGLRGEWLVEATEIGSGRRLLWEVRGRAPSRQAVAEVARALERGILDVDPRGATRLK